MFNAIDAKGKDILTLSPQYFQLRKPLERRLYEIARKHCGQNTKWAFKMETLHKRTGSKSPMKEFRRMVRTIVDMNEKKAHIPDYTFTLENDLFIIRPRGQFTEIYTDTEASSAIRRLNIMSSGYESARKFAAGYDIYYLEEEWRSMLYARNSVPKSPEGSFVNFVKKYVKTNGATR